MTPHTSFLSEAHLHELGLRNIGKNVKISCKTSIYGAENIHIGDNVRIDDFCILSGGAGIHIGNFIHISAYSALFGGAGIQIDDFVNISSRSVLYSESDDGTGVSLVGPFIPMDLKPRYRSAPIRLERHAVVATNSTILPGVVLEEGAVLTAHSVAIKVCKMWAYYGGVPAVRIRERKRDLLELEKQFFGRLL